MQTFGNHEFDSGPALAAEFAANLTELGIPVLACNLDVSQEPAFDGVELQVRCYDGAVCRGSASARTKRCRSNCSGGAVPGMKFTCCNHPQPSMQNFTIIELPKSNTKVGVVGLTTTDTTFTSSPGRQFLCCDGWGLFIEARKLRCSRALWLPPAPVDWQLFASAEAPAAQVASYAPHSAPACHTCPPAGRNIVFKNYTDALPGCVAAAKAAGAERIIALTHIGYGEDQALAADAAAAGVDLIVGAWSRGGLLCLHAQSAIGLHASHQLRRSLTVRVAVLR